MSETVDLKRVAAELRHRLVRMSNAAKTPHLGSGLSCIDILVAAYWNVLRIDPQQADDANRDRLILSKGHAATALYAVLARRGFFSEELLESFGHPGAPLAEQPAPGCAPGVELATGSLGHGLPVGVGMAMAARLKKLSHRVLVVMSDGECNEGTVWEAAMFAAARGLGNLSVVVDYNKWQATGRSNEVMQLSSFVDKWSAFGWNASEVDGHDIDAITGKLNDPRDDQPTAIVAHTVKGKGISFMEDDNNWHYRIPTEEEVEQAAVELGLR